MITIEWFACVDCTHHKGPKRAAPRFEHKCHHPALALAEPKPCAARRVEDEADTCGFYGAQFVRAER